MGREERQNRLERRHRVRSSYLVGVAQTACSMVNALWFSKKQNQSAVGHYNKTVGTLYGLRAGKSTILAWI